MQGLTDDKGKEKQLVQVKYFLYLAVDQPPNMIMSSDRGLVTALSPPENPACNAVPEQVGASFSVSPSENVFLVSDPSEHSMFSSLFNWQVSLAINTQQKNTPQMTYVCPLQRVPNEACHGLVGLLTPFK
jgi:hypothetical protein